MKKKNILKERKYRYSLAQDIRNFRRAGSIQASEMKR